MITMVSCQKGPNRHAYAWQKGPYPPCLRMADRALLAGYPRIVFSMEAVADVGKWIFVNTKPINISNTSLKKDDVA